MSKQKDIINRPHTPDVFEGPNRTYVENPDDVNGEISLIFRRNKKGQTYLARQYFKLPMQILRPHYYEDDGTMFVMSLNPAGGILQHDRLRTTLVSEAGTDTVFTTPGNNKFYRMDEGYALVENRLTVKAGGVLEYLPEHNVPFEGATVYQENEFRIERGGVLFAADMVTAGRALNDEIFKYDLYQSRTRIYVEDELVLYDNCHMEPEKEDLRATGLLEGYLSNGSMYVYADNMDPGLAQEINRLGGGGKDILLAAGNITPELMVVRFLGDSIIDMKRTMLEVWGLCRKSILGKDPVRLRTEFRA